MTTMEVLTGVAATEPKEGLLARIAKRIRALSNWPFVPLASIQAHMEGLSDYLLIAPSCGEWLDPRLWDLLNEVGKAAEAKPDKTKCTLDRTGAL